MLSILFPLITYNPELWNSWKNSLLWDLYLSAGHALRRGLKNPVERETRIRLRRSRTLSRLLRSGMSAEPIRELWDTLPNHVFLRLKAGQLEWATRAVLESGIGRDLIEIRAVKPQGISEVLVCVADSDEPIMLESVERLNTPAVLEAYCAEFG